MQCPHDGSVLVMAERKGVEIDYCPQCRGVWLDRGELDKIVDRSMEAEIAAEAGGPAATAGTPPYASAGATRSHDRSDDPRLDPRYDPRGAGRYDDGWGRDPRQDDRGDPRRDEYRRRKKKESWLGDLFDF